MAKVLDKIICAFLNTHINHQEGSNNIRRSIKKLYTRKPEAKCFKRLCGTVKLPMPNNLTDSNNVNWGSDVMNNLSAAIVSGYTANPGATAAAALAGSALVVSLEFKVLELLVL